MHYFNYINALHGFSKNLRGPLFKFMSKIIFFFFTKNTKGRKDFWKVKEGHGQDFTVKQTDTHMLMKLKNTWSFFLLYVLSKSTPPPPKKKHHLWLYSYPFFFLFFLGEKI